ncbi:hypothetical protein ABMA28_004206 [Loxostege sticticalis]|uniref:Integrase catalytic domain-containing protein n=1 Tax=Loxostege sticticalis TaxID=481309 RepID=A0ABD0SUM3_LOXSC
MAEEIKVKINLLVDTSSKLTKFVTNTKKTAKAKITRGYLDARLETLNDYWANFTKQYEALISQLNYEELKCEEVDINLNYEVTEEAYLDLKTFIADYMHEFKKHDFKSTEKKQKENTDSHTSSVRPKLPPIPIPKFSGDYNDWLSFRDLFKSLIHNDSSLSKIEKHHYLKSSLSGDAELLLKNILLTEANYDDAWKKLEDRYDNKRIIVTNILNCLMNQKKITAESTKGIKDLLDTTSQCLSSLNNLQINTSSWDAIIVHIVVSKLDTESHKLWEQSLGSNTNIPKYTELASFLENRFRTMEMIYNTTHKEFQKREVNKVNQNYQPKVNMKTFATEVDTTCTYCSQNHYICHCKEFATLSVPERQCFVKKNNICFNCLVKGHLVTHCRQSSTCRKCGRRHHTLLHATTLSQTVPTPEVTSAETSEKSTSCNFNEKQFDTCRLNEQVVLATAQIAVKAKNGSIYQLRALIDQGSQASFISEAAAQLLNLDRTSVMGKVTGIANTSVVTTKSVVTLQVHAKQPSTSTFEVSAYVLGKLTSLLPSREIPQDTWSLTKQLDLADPEFHKPGSIDVLLGADVHAHIILEGLHKHDCLIALNSRLGWLISGKIRQADSHKHNVIVTHAKLELDQLLRQFWEVEEQIPHTKKLTPLEVQCEEYFKETHTRNEDGRYVVRLPFNENPPTNLGSTKDLAVRRLQQMERRFTRDPSFKQEYHKFMTEYESQGHMEKVPVNEKERNTNLTYYLPHHAVLRPTSLSTKLRVVFDGSAAPETQKSLNDELLIGCSLQPDIRDLITRWRQHQFVLVADIQKMYRQILVSKEDVDYQRIVWRESPNLPIEEYRLLTVTYGTSCAPFLAIRTIQQLAIDESLEFPEEAEILKNDVYMDDLMTGTSSEAHAAELQMRLEQLLARGGFPLHKWASNSDLVLNQIPNTKCNESQDTINIKIEDMVKTLGITWNSQSDCFELKFSLEPTAKNITKRNVLSAIAKTFDPLGWLAPAIITLKIFMQKLWLAGLDWDEELPQQLRDEWLTYLSNFTLTEGIQFPRWLNVTENTSRVELHGFSDASCAAYACVVYLRVFDGDRVHVNLIMSKAKVAPVKQVSLPRLELCGSVLLARMLNHLKTLLQIEDENVFAWSDSTIVLAWLRKTPSAWTTFVANRTSEILTLTNSSQWSHIDSANNPADVASRGLSPIDLQSSELWWEGPAFLKEPTVSFDRNVILPETNLESKVKLCANVTVNEPDNDVHNYLNRFSTLSKLIRVTAYCLRFIHNCKLKTKNKCTYLTSDEIKNSLIVCTRLSQSVNFKEEIDLLSQGKPVHKSSKIYTLNPYLDDDQLLRVGGRLCNARVPTYTKSPIVLSNHCNFAKLVVLNAHANTLHGGNQLTLNYIRQRYWIVRVKNLVKAIIQKCITCYKFKAVPLAPFMGNLPEFRVNPGRPFLTSGVDFAGPFTLKMFSGRCKKTYKAYVSLFVCTVTKAIHLELVTDLTSSAFLAAFKRFTSRRGNCRDIWSDCGTNFVGASRELDLAFKHLKSNVVAEIAELLANDHTTWHFIPPGTPHFGGLWESGVKSIKGHLKRVVGSTILTYEEFSTLLTQVEACVNSRPLTLISSSLDEPPLTPGHFLIGEPLVAVPEPSLVDTKLSPLDRWNMIQKMLQCLWQRWQSEYLTSLQHRYKWNVAQPSIALDSIVLVKDDRLPPGKWLLARVIEKHPGSDGITRVVTLKTSNSCFKRPVTKLCPLPLGDSVSVI